MTDIVERLRGEARIFRKHDLPPAVKLLTCEAADEIERLRARLEIDPSHPYDGIYARDETIRQQDKQIARLRAGGCARDQGTTQYCAEAAKLAVENERLRAALHDVLGWHDYSNDMHKPIEVRAAYMRARAALEGRSCTCHPSEAPTPCQRKYALDDCIKTALEARDE